MRRKGIEKARVGRIAFGLILCLLGIGIPAFAQVFTGSISGTLTDTSGAIIPSANLMLTQANTGLQVMTSSDASGLFVFPSVEPGEYTLKIDKDGFKTLEKTSITLQTGQRLALGTIALSVGSATQTVTVTAQAAVVDTETAAHAGYIDSEQVETQLLLGRNIAGLATLLPGISGGGTSASLDRNGSSFSSQGARTDANRFSVDGVNSTDIDNGTDIKLQQSADAIAEVTVLQNDYEAEYANAAGAMVIQTTKSGTKDFHGGFNYYDKNEAFNANSYFNKRNGQKRDRIRVYNFNYLIGGPVTFKGFNRNRDKLFFFWNQEFWPNSGSNSYRITVPTDLERAGDFSQSYQSDGKTLRVVKDPTTGQPFPGNKIPANRFDANGQAMLNVFPHANFTNTAVSNYQYNYVGQGAFKTPNSTRTLKIDFNPSAKDRFAASWTGFHEDSEGFASTGGWFNGGTNWPLLYAKFTAANNGLSGRWTHTISSSTVNEAGFSWQTNPEKAVTTAGGGLKAGAPLQSTYGINLPVLSSSGNPLGYLPGMNFGGVPNSAGIQSATGYQWLPYTAPNNVYNWTDKLSSLKGVHFVKAGVEVMRFWRGIPSNVSRFGSYDFSPNSLNPLDTSYAYANAILGSFNTYQETNADPYQKAVGGDYSLFIQDTWKVGSRLSLDYGLRFQYEIPVGQQNNLFAQFYPAAYKPSRAVTLYRPGTNSSGQPVAVNPITGQQYPSAAIGAIIPGSGTLFDGMVSPTLHNAPVSTVTDDRGVQVVPRFGFSWDIFGDHKTALRGGTGVFLSQPPINQYRNLVAQPPLVQSPEVFYSTISSLKGAAQYLFPESVSGNNYNDKLPVSYNFNLDVQREIGFNTIVDAGYVGATSRHLLQTQNLNSIPFGSDFSNPGVPQLLLRPIQGYGDISMLLFTGTSNYHSLQVTANRRQGKWLVYGINYTWSKAMDYGSADESSISSLIPIRKRNYSKADFDQTHALKANWLWTLPQVPWQNFAAKEVLGGWQVSGQAFFLSGNPTNPGLGLTNSVDFTGSPTDGARVNITGNPNLSHGSQTFSHAFNTSAFSIPAVGTYGTASRNPLVKPGSQTWNLAVLKTLQFTERINLELRAETYNTFNHTNFSSFNFTPVFKTNVPTSDPTYGQQISTSFGQYTGTLNPRQMQLGARFSF